MSDPPTNIRALQADQILELTWPDNRVDRLLYRFLRSECPCATCRNEWTGERMLDPASIRRRLEGGEHATGWDLRDPARLERRTFLGSLLLGDLKGARRSILRFQLRLEKSVADSHANTLLTVAVPTCNGAAHLAETLRSILTQEGPEFELVISDDRSDDQTLELVRAVAGDRAGRGQLRASWPGG